MATFGYARVSTRDQDLAGQIAELKAAGCGNIFKEKARRFSADPEIQALLREIHGGDQTYDGLLNGYSSETARKLKEATFDLETLAKRGFRYEKLDQLTIELLLGTR